LSDSQLALVRRARETADLKVELLHEPGYHQTKSE
jgi:hypothetical protein